MPKLNLLSSFWKQNKIIFAMFILSLGLSNGIASASATSSHVSHCRINNPGVSAKVVSGVYQIHVDTYTPGTKFCFFVPSSSNGNYSSANPSISGVQNLDHAVAISYTQPTLVPLNSSDTPIATINSSKGLRTIQIFALPTNFPRFITFGEIEDLSNLNLLTTPVYNGIDYAIAIENGQIAFWTSGKYVVETLRQLNDFPQKLTAESYAYSYFTTSGPTGSYSPGTWHFLNAAFQEVGSLSTLNSSGEKLLPEGHDMTLSGASNPVVISYVPISVDSSWLDRPLSSQTVLDCRISEVQNGEAIHSFSFWDWAVRHKDPWKQLINNVNYPALTPLVQIIGSTQTAIDGFHCNSVQYLSSKDEFLVSMRGTSTVVVLSGDLTTVQNLITFPGAAQHFAKSNDGINFSMFGNYPFEKNSKFVSWTFNDLKHSPKYSDLPLLVGNCGNANQLSESNLWVGGGCGSLTNQATAFAVPKNVTIIGEYIRNFDTKPNISGILAVEGVGDYSYRTDIFTPATLLGP